jgi:hypothetical protein
MHRSLEFSLEILLRFDLPVPNGLNLARRWLMLCPIRKNDDGSAKETNAFERNSIRNDPEKSRDDSNSTQRRFLVDAFARSKHRFASGLLI